MKRFYKVVTTSPTANGFEIHLDGKPVRTPARQLLLAPTQKLADEVLKEWAAQVDVINPETMPITQILTTGSSADGHDRATIMVEVLRYLDTDLLCYRTDDPPAVAKLQAEQWGRWTDWFAAQSGVSLNITTGLVALTQPQAAHDYAVAVISAADAWHFTAIQMVTAISGSVILALAFVDGAASADDVFKAAQLEELYRNELYREDFYGKAPHQEKIYNGILRDLNALRVFLDALS